MTEENRLKLRAVATEDVEIMSALLQDGLVAASDLHYQTDAASFVMVINRFCWEQSDGTELQTQPNRCLCGLRIAHVKRVSQRGLSALRAHMPPNSCFRGLFSKGPCAQLLAVKVGSDS